MDDFPDLTDPRPLLPPALLHHSLRLIPDPRDQRRPKHALPDLLFISLCSLLTGGDSFQDMADFASDEAAWLRTVIPFQGGPPSHDTFTRVFALLDTHAFEGAVRHWMRQLIPATPAPSGSGPASPALRQVASDGKKLRGSRRGQPGALQMAATVNLWCIEEGLCLAQRRIPEASGEGPQCELLLRHLQLKGVILSGDAAYCQHSLASYVNAQGGDYVLNLKGNQPEAKDEIHPLLETLAASRPPDLEQTEKGHGRLETRRCSSHRGRRRSRLPGPMERPHQHCPLRARNPRSDHRQGHPRAAVFRHQPPARRRIDRPQRASALAGGEQPALAA